MVDLALRAQAKSFGADVDAAANLAPQLERVLTMPRKKTPGRPPAANARTQILFDIMDDFAALFPASSHAGRDGFEHVDHPPELQKLWAVANDFPPISTGAAHADERRIFYSRLRRSVKVNGAFRKGTAANNKLWDRIQANLTKLEQTR